MTRYGDRSGSWHLWLTVAIVLSLAGIKILVFPRIVWACECAPHPPPCVAYAQTQLIFLGTVTEALETDGGHPRLVRMRIDKAYKGISKESVVLYDDGMCDGPVLRVGEQYLMYTAGDPDGQLPARGCTRSRHVKYATEDLAFLDNLLSAPPTATVFGQVTIKPDRIEGENSPASDASVELQGEGETRTLKTDRNGRYTFIGLKPGSYAITRVTKPGFEQLEPRDEEPVEIPERGCALWDEVLRKDWQGSIAGRVVRSDGLAVPAGISVGLIRIEGTGRTQKTDLLINQMVETDENGYYSFTGVAPGSYKIALNIYKVPSGEYPYLPTYWPAAHSDASATTVNVDSAVGARYDFRLPTPLGSQRIQFVVLLPDGTPAKEANINIGTEMDGSFAWAGSAITDESGRFSFVAISGFQYSIEDIFTDEAKLDKRVAFSASDHERALIIRLVMRER